MFDPDQPIDLRTNYPGSVNTEHERIYNNMWVNIRRQLPQLEPYPANEYKAMLLCGGPSLNDYVQEIKRKRKAGWKLITVNGVHDWALDHGMTPSLQIMIDGRAFNTRFVQRPQETCRYAIASQAATEVFDALEGYDVHIWHTGFSSAKEKRILDRYYGFPIGKTLSRHWFAVPGGTSVGTRAIGIATTIGIRRLDLYGFDCCYRDDTHHAYEQPENDYGKGSQWGVKIGRRKFRADPWMTLQADEFCQMASHLPHDLKMNVKGDGIVAYLISEYAAGRNPKRRIL